LVANRNKAQVEVAKAIAGERRCLNLFAVFRNAEVRKDTRHPFAGGAVNNNFHRPAS
jgi:hypothetical protein